MNTKPVTSTQMKMTRDINIKEAKTADLVAWYNENSGSTRKLERFRDRADAEKRVGVLYEAIKELSTATSKPSEAKKAEKAQKQASPKPEGETRGRTSKFVGFTIIRAKENGKPIDNPRREGSIGHKSFAVIKDGMKFEAYVAAGGRSVDLQWDLDHKYVTVEAPKA